VSLLTLTTFTGYTPSIYKSRAESRLITLDQARQAAAGPICILPEATTSNGRGLLRFGEGFGGGLDVPVRGWKVWVVYFKHPPPSPHQPSATLSSPLTSWPLPNPLPHLLTSLLPTLIPRTLAIKILHPDSSLSSGDFVPSITLGLDATKYAVAESTSTNNAVVQPINVFSECVAVLMRDLGRTKRLGLGWEDKEGFLGYVEERRQGSARKKKATKTSTNAKLRSGGRRN